MHILSFLEINFSQLAQLNTVWVMPLRFSI